MIMSTSEVCMNSSKVPPRILLWFMLMTTCSTNAFTTPVAPLRPRRSSPCTSFTSLGVASSNNKKQRRKNGSTKSKPRQKSLRPQSPPQRRRPGDKFSKTTTASPPPDLTGYNRVVHGNNNYNDERIACPHFGDCSGCVVDAHVEDTPVVRSARMYFSSTAVRQRRTDVQTHRRNDDDGTDFFDYDDDDDDALYRVVVPTDVTAWRTQAKLAVAPQSSAWARRDGCTLGLYARGSHDVLPIPDCAVHHPAINRAVDIVQRCTAQVGTPAHCEASDGGGLRYVQCQVERTTGRICLTTVWFASHLKQTQPALARLTKALQQAAPDLWHSMWCHCNDGLGNAIFHRDPRRWHRLVGPEFLREPLPTMGGGGGDDDGNDDDANKAAPGWLYFTPMTFRQGNLDGFSVLAVDVARAVPPHAKVCELYAGVGVLGLTALAHHAKHSPQPLQWLRCSDENPGNLRCFQRAVASLPAAVVTGSAPPPTDRRGGSSPPGAASTDTEGLTLAELAKLMEEKGDENDFFSETPRGPKTDYRVASAGQALRAGQALGANVLIVDPPRRGLEDAVLDELCKPFQPNQPYVESASLLSTDDRGTTVHWTNDVRTLIYVSCGFDALARDADRLLTRGGWRLERATGYVLFPGGDHVETLAVFQR